MNQRTVQPYRPHDLARFPSVRAGGPLFGLSRKRLDPPTTRQRSRRGPVVPRWTRPVESRAMRFWPGCCCAEETGTGTEPGTGTGTQPGTGTEDIFTGTDTHSDCICCPDGVAYAWVARIEGNAICPTLPSCPGACEALNGEFLMYPNGGGSNGCGSPEGALGCCWSYDDEESLPCVLQTLRLVCFFGADRVWQLLNFGGQGSLLINDDFNCLGENLFTMEDCGLTFCTVDEILVYPA